MTDRSRRRFLGSAAAAAVVAPFISTSATRAAAERSQKKIGVAVCGIGRLTEGQIAPALAANSKHCRLAGVISGTPAKAEEWKKKHNLPAKSVYDYKTMNRMADNKDIDIVYVVTPNALHLEHALAAYRAGRGTLFEALAARRALLDAQLEHLMRQVETARAAVALDYFARFQGVEP